MPKPITWLAALLAAAPSTHAQAPSAAAPLPLEAASPEGLLAAWRARYGASWDQRLNPRTGTLELLFGGNAAPSFVPDTSRDADWFQLGREWIAATEAMHGVAVEDLRDTRVFFLPLAQGNTTDKVTVRFDQVIDGVPVERGRVNVLFDVAGRLLSLHSSAAPLVADRGTRPAFDGGFASLVARDTFQRAEGLEPNHYGAPALVFAYVDDEETRRWTLAWQVDAQWTEPGFEPRGTTFTLDARTRQVLRREDSVHHLDVTGTVRTMATPGVAADHPGNPPAPAPVPYARVTSSAGTVFTDGNGDFTFPGVNTPLDVTVRYSGTFTDVNNSAGADHTQVFTSVPPNQPNALLMNAAPVGPVTAQANAYLWVNRQRDWIRSVFPNDTTADFLSTTNVNITDTCNAFFNGVSTNYYLPGGGCNNTAFSSVVAHEMGHWLNVLYGTGNNSDGMGEGNADTFSTYMLDEPLIGPYFYTSGAAIRDANNTRQFCGDTMVGCHPGVHANGEVWMGAAWKVRTELDNALGNTLGDLQANLLFLGWMNAYNQAELRSVIEPQWLTLDDDDGNIANGTPNYAAIDAGFVAQGFPGYSLRLFEFSNVTVLATTTDTAGPYVVDADVVATFNPPLQSVSLRYRVDAGVTQVVPMVNVGGDTYRASIPGQPDPSGVEYVIDAVDGSAAQGSFPATSLAQGVHFAVGQVSTIVAFDFEAQGPSGWNRVGGGGGGAGAWVHDNPVGTAAQPEDDHTPAPGTRCWFTGQGAPGGALGAADVDDGATSLLSSVFDLSGTVIPQVSYWRWFSNDQGTSPGEDVLVVQLSNNGGSSWVTAETVGPIGDDSVGGWRRHEVLVGSLLTPTDNMRLRFTVSDVIGDSIVEAAVDDVRVVSVESIVAPPTNYCTVNPNSTGGVGSITWAGSQSVLRNEGALRGDGFPPGVVGLFYFGDQRTQQPVAGTTAVRCVGGTVRRLPVTVTDSLVGAAYQALDLHAPGSPASAITAGSTWHFQFWHRDAVGGAATSSTSNGLTVEFGL